MSPPIFSDYKPTADAAVVTALCRVTWDPDTPPSLTIRVSDVIPRTTSTLTRLAIAGEAVNAVGIVYLQTIVGGVVPYSFDARPSALREIPHKAA